MTPDIDHLTELHRKAMQFAMDGMTLRDRGRSTEALPVLRQAYALEREVALALTDALDLEPSRSAMFLSAASLANLCGDSGDALHLIRLGLGGNPPAAIRGDLAQLEQAVEAGRLDTPRRGMNRAAEEMQMAASALVAEAAAVPAPGQGLADILKRVEEHALAASAATDRFRAEREAGHHPSHWDMVNAQRARTEALDDLVRFYVVGRTNRTEAP